MKIRKEKKEDETSTKRTGEKRKVVGKRMSREQRSPNKDERPTSKTLQKREDGTEDSKTLDGRQDEKSKTRT
jgi:hypothetical protein